MGRDNNDKNEKQLFFDEKIDIYNEDHPKITKADLASQMGYEQKYFYKCLSGKKILN